MAIDLIANVRGGREAELAQLAKLVGSDRRTAIDVGANCGYYTLAMHKLFARVIASEPNRLISSPIRQAAFANVELHDVAFSDRNGTGTLYIPVRGGMVLDGWSSLNSEHTQSDATLKMDIELTTLDSLGVGDVAFIKIDVEGHEIEVLNGARDTIARSLPMCLIETDGENERQVEAFFKQISPLYQAHTHWNGVTVSKQNRLYVLTT